MKPNRQRAEELYAKIIDSGVSHQALLEYIINDFMDGQQAVETMQAANKEFFFNDVETYRSSSDWNDDDYDDEGDDD